VLKRLFDFFKEYRQLGLVTASVLIALPFDLFGQHKVSHIILGLSALINVSPFMWKMLQDFRIGKYGVDILAITAVITAILMQEYWAGIIIVLMMTGGVALEDFAQARAKTELTALLSRVPTKAHLIKGRKTLEVPVEQIRANDKIIIKPGEVVPVDAVILEGTASFDESSLTGESLPSIKKPGDELVSGSINLDGLITARSIHSAEDSQLEQIIKFVKSASTSKAPFVRMADRYSIPFTLIAFVIGIGAWIISGHSIRFLEVLVVATPCPLILGAPIALISGMSRAAKHGIIVKTGLAMERLADIKTIGFDKTGTLTKGQPKVGEITVYEPFNEQTVLELAAALEQHSNHVLSKAIVNEAAKHSGKLIKAKNVRELAGNGLSAHVQGKQMLVGRFGLVTDYDVTLPKNFNMETVQQTAAFVAVDGLLAGVITFKDEIRPESKRTLARLKEMGIKHILMVTGDNKATANIIAKELGIEEVLAEALPVDKLHAVERVKVKPVGFVGDGVNDAPVLAAADVGIALGARGSTGASESADVVIMTDNVEQVANGVNIAKRTFFIARQSILAGIFISIGLMFVFSSGKFRPVYGALTQEVVDVLVIFNALRAHGSWQKLRSKQRPAKA